MPNDCLNTPICTCTKCGSSEPSIETLRAQIAELTAQRNMAIQHLAEWGVAIDINGSGWDDWDEYYKDAMYDRPNALREIRELLKVAIEEARKRRENRY